MAANKVLFEIDALDKGAVDGFASLSRAQKELQSETRKENILLEKQVEILKKQNKESKNSNKPTVPMKEPAKENPFKVMGGGWSSAEGMTGAALGAMGIGSIIDPLVRGLEAWEASVALVRERQTALSKEQNELGKATGPGMLYMSPEEREEYSTSRNEIAEETGKELTWFDPLQKAIMPVVKNMGELESAMRAIAIASTAGVSSDESLIEFEKKSIESGMAPGVGTNVLYEASKRSGSPEEFQSLIPIITEMENLPNAIAMAITAVKQSEDGKAGEMLEAMKSLQDTEGLEELKKTVGLKENQGGEIVIQKIEEFISNTQNNQGVSRDKVISELVTGKLLSKEQGEALNVMGGVEENIDKQFIQRQTEAGSEHAINGLITALDDLRKSMPAFDQAIKSDIQKVKGDLNNVVDPTPEQIKIQEDERLFADRLQAAGMEELLNPDTNLFDDSRYKRSKAENALKIEEDAIKPALPNEAYYGQAMGGSAEGFNQMFASLFKWNQGIDTSNKDQSKMEELLAQIAANTQSKNTDSGPVAAPNRNAGR